MQTDLLKRLISSVHANENNVLFDCVNVNELDKEQLEILAGFHMNELYLIEEKDDYFCGIRADHFCVEYGTSEYVTANGIPCFLILITANHKGFRVMTLLKILG